MHPPSRTIAIIGGGFCGTVLAANLLRTRPARPTRIVLVERGPSIGCGLAYGPGNPEYLLNTPAGRMSAASAEPEQLVEFARSRYPDVDADSYLPRQFYGEYLQAFLRSAQRAAPSEFRFECLRGDASAITAKAGAKPGAQSGTEGWLVHLGDQPLHADQVVLACGDPPPAARPYAAAVGEHPAYVCDPHAQHALRASDDAVLLIGSGLTMVDLAVAAAARNPGVKLFALSRHGLLPEAQLATSQPAADCDLQPLLESRSTRALLGAVRASVRSAQARGGDWRDVIMRLRPHVPQLWQVLGESERRRFLRHVRAYWDTHRHRMPPALSQRIGELRRNGQLQLRAGRVEQLRGAGERIVVRWRERGGHDVRELNVARVIDCSGADRRLERTPDPLWRSLLDAGHVMADAAGLGVRTGAHGALIARDGRAASGLVYLGPMLRADYWESTAVGELRARAEALASWLAQPEPSARAVVAGIARCG